MRYNNICCNIDQNVRCSTSTYNGNIYTVILGEQAAPSEAVDTKKSKLKLADYMSKSSIAYFKFSLYIYYTITVF
jgi:hypothetical protein